MWAALRDQQEAEAPAASDSGWPEASGRNEGGGGMELEGQRGGPGQAHRLSCSGWKHFKVIDPANSLLIKICSILLP